MKGVVTVSAAGSWIAMFSQANVWSTGCFLMSVGGAIWTWVLARRAEKLESESATRRHQEMMDAMQALLINDTRVGKILADAIKPHCFPAQEVKE
jgi:hypothetical protein